MTQGTLTTEAGAPVLVQDQLLLEKLAHFNREFLSEVGKQTETFLRFSTVADSLGGADARRDPRGWALKFYTEEGNYDLVGNNTPVFFIKDAIKFPDFIHTQGATLPHALRARGDPHRAARSRTTSGTSGGCLPSPSTR